METNTSIYFGEVDSPEYEKAVLTAAKFDHFLPATEDNKLNTIETNNQEIVEKYPLFEQLINTIGSWQLAGVRFKGREIDPVSWFLSIKDITECAIGYNESDDKSNYCDDKKSNCWGCKHLKGIILRHPDAPFQKQFKYWYQYGAYINATTWAVNKEELTEALTQIVEKKNIDFCPIFRPAFFRKIIAALPAFIDVTDTENWAQVYPEDSISDVRRWEAISVQHKIQSTEKDRFDSESDPTGMGKQKTRGRKEGENKYLRYVPETSFDDVGGIDDIIMQIREVIELPIKKPELFDHLGIRPYRGILLWGEPGNGKTLIAKAIAHEVRAHFIPVVGPDILNKNFGESEFNLREIFEEARTLQPSIIFFDELDSIAQSRLAGETSKWYATVVNQLLSLMDGIRGFGNVTVLASTNRPDLLDPAFMRPGRFDYKLEVRKPNLVGCKKVLEIATRNMPLANDVNLLTFAEKVIGYSAAEITFLAKEAALVALRRAIDIRAAVEDPDSVPDFSKLEVKKDDFFTALIILKKNAHYVSKTYSLK